ncbi:hypothetical protein GCM10010174_27520 [Kutzneria viridogrisea]
MGELIADMAEATGLADFLARLNWSPEKLAREINRLRGDGTVSPKAPYHWLRGSYPRKGIPETVVAVLSEHLHENVDIGSVWPGSPRTPASPGVVGQRRLTPLVSDSCASARLVQSVSQTNADESTLAQVRGKLHGIALSYLHVPPSALIYRAAMGRDRVARLLQGHQRPAERRELLVLGAKFCTLLAWMSDDLGDGNAAYNQASAAWDLADLAEDNEARRWARIAQARLAHGARHHLEAARLATQGLACPAEDGLDTVLTLVAARAWAEAGLAEEARRALAKAEALRERNEGGRRGVPHLDRDGEAQLAGRTLLALGDLDGALTELTDALDWCHRLPTSGRSYAVEALIRIDLMRALLRGGELCRGLCVLGPVLDLAPEQLINEVRLGLRAARDELLSGEHRTDNARRVADTLRARLSAASVTPDLTP